MMPCHPSRILSPLVVGLCVLAAARAALAQQSPEDTVKSFKVAEGLEATVWATEPGMVNPTDMDIDERGRIWVLEGANYRGSKLRPAGDRIMVLEDTDHDGACDKYHVFLQDPELVSPLGVAKLGDKLYVSQSPNVMVYTIEESADGPKPAGKPEVIFTGFGGTNHDHGVHAFVFGPDGRLYFNCGNDGGSSYVKFGDGKPVVDVTGSEVGVQSKTHRGKPKGRDNLGYTDGLAFRWDPAAKKFEVLGHNFRNNYELCVDSFGTVWQSDNDDDGNESVRLNYVMEGGNFGFKGPRGTNWQRDKDVIPGQTRQEAHWHQRWPGVVPNMIHTGGGSPTGICVYEGELLPEQFRGAILHCDAGPNVVRAFMPRPAADGPKGLMTADAEKQRAEAEGAGAGYKATYVDLILAQDKWFRPADVCVAPDGSVFVCDWYDPGVGGHATGDKDAQKLRGRIYRLAPKGFKPAAPKLDLDSPRGQIAALCSPNQATRYLGYTRLAAGGEPARAALAGFASKSGNARLMARALWLLAVGPDGKQVVGETINRAKDLDVRVAAIRMARRIGMDMTAVARELAADPSIVIARELCLAMYHEPTDKALPVLVALADRYDGKDRWYLEALGIGATGRENELLEAWLRDGKNKDPKVVEGITWRMKKPTPGTAAAPAPQDHSPGAAASAAVAVPRSKEGRTLPSPAELAKLSGDAAAGAAIFRDSTGANCVACHEIGDEGRMVGPPLTTIGQKLSKEQLYQAILYPNEALLMGYETWVVKTKSGQVFAGLKTSDTPEQVTIKDSSGKYHDIDAADVARKTVQKVSLMPEGLAGTMTMTQLVDLVEYLSTLRNKA